MMQILLSAETNEFLIMNKHITYDYYQQRKAKYKKELILELKTIISEVKNSLGRFNGRLETPILVSKLETG